jgi:signal transduction histidine kinase
MELHIVSVNYCCLSLLLLVETKNDFLFPMLWREKKLILVMTGFMICSRLSSMAEHALAGADSNLIEVKLVTVREKVVSKPGEKKVSLGSSPDNITFHFGFTTNANRAPIRISCKLEGYDKDWDMGGGEMFLVVRFYNDAGDIVSHTQFEVHGESPGWQHDLEHSSLTHRRETIVVPPHASKFMVVLSSAGPQTTEGIYVVTDLNVSEFSKNDEPQVLLRFPDGQKRNPINSATDTWQRDGTSPTMAKYVDLGQIPKTEALAIYDDDPIGHAEWHNTLHSVPHVTPGDHLVIEWNEMFSIGDNAMSYAPYPSLAPGNYRFRVMEVDLMGAPTGIETSLAVVVPQPFWKTLWFWGIIATGIIATAAMIWRYIARIRTRRQLLILERQRLLEQERLRIARDIHDDLGARVTQISLVSAMAYNGPNNAEKMRIELDQISQMSRDLVTALYETVWTVNPENDNLKELGNFLFQIVNDSCERGSCRCRFHIEDLPREIIVLSHLRHNLCMVVKEAMNNITKHAKATEVKLSITFRNFLLTIHIQDDGSGFDLSNKPAGHGLTNIQRRLEEIGGRQRIESQPGQGTNIWIYLDIKAHTT